MVGTKKDVLKVSPYTDAFLLGVQDFSTNFACYFTVAEISKLVNELPEKEIFVSVNKNMHEQDLEPLKKLLRKLNNLNIAGIYYYDPALVLLKQEGIIKHPLIWHQEHLTTNYATCNFWHQAGVSGACLSGEITLKEILEIQKHVTMPLTVPVFGYLPMFVSRRNLVENYLKIFHLPKKGEHYQIRKEGYTYPIINDSMGTQVYSSHILNAYRELSILKEARISYVLLNGFQIPSDIFLEVLKLYQSEDGNEEVESQISDLLNQNTDKGFLYKETIYRVKK